MAYKCQREEPKEPGEGPVAADIESQKEDGNQEKQKEEEREDEDPR